MFLQHSPRMPAHPLVLRRDQFHQFFVAQLLKVHFGRLLVFVNDLVDAAVAAVMTVLAVMVTLVLVIPVDDVN